MVGDIDRHRLRGRRVAARQHEAIAQAQHLLALGPHQAQALQLLEQGARMHVAADIARERLEAGRRPLARQMGPGPALGIAAGQIGDPAGEQHRRGGGRQRRPARQLGLHLAHILAVHARQHAQRRIGDPLAAALQLAAALVEIDLLERARERAQRHAMPEQPAHHRREHDRRIGQHGGGRVVDGIGVGGRKTHDQRDSLHETATHP